ncbi:MAG: penicillin acylase family protein, partial [bacterium]
MKRTIKICAALAVLVMAGGCALLTNFHYNAMRSYEKDPALADYNAKVEIPGLNGRVDVYRDKWAIPHIFADNPHDLFFAAGYVQAQDRLFQMIMFRAIAEGRTAELLGDISVPGVKMAGMPLSTTGLDKHQRIMGMNYLGKLGEAMLRETNPRVYNQLQAFCDGVNAYMDSRQELESLPVEFQILKVKPKHWRVRDIISFSKFIGSLLCSNMAVELPRYAAIKKYGPDKGWRLFPIHGAPGPSIVPTSMLKNRLDTPRDIPPGGRPSQEEIGYELDLSAGAASTLLAAERLYRQALNIDPAIGSNNWVVSGKLTESGAAMLVNDPHLQHVEPSLFYMMRLKGAGYNAYGVTFAGNPYVVLGHTRKLGWGATTSRADVQDLFIEKTDPDRPGKYFYKGEWRPFQVRKETYQVRVGKR